VESARPAAEADTARVAELRAVAQAELRAQTRGGPVFVAGEAARFSPSYTVVGEFDGVVVGFGAAAASDLADGSRLGVIGELFVEAEGRAVGVGEAMIGLLLDWCRSQGCAGVDAFALPGTRETKNFFETFGFTARLLVVHHRLDGVDDPA
jgi:GNAT superfamily N-acetyltransferase